MLILVSLNILKTFNCLKIFNLGPRMIGPLDRLFVFCLFLGRCRRPDLPCKLSVT